MELKFGALRPPPFPRCLLIEPCGIEMRNTEARQECLSQLLIEPCGIEIIEGTIIQRMFPPF